MKDLKETDLAKVFISHFEDMGDIYQEVDTGHGRVDFVVKTPRIVIGVEVKKSFSLQVIEQAKRNKHSFHYSYVAVPDTKNSYFAKEVCKMFGLGVLVCRRSHYYDNDPDSDFKVVRKLRWEVSEVIKPDLFRKPFLPRLEEYMKQGIAGSKSGGSMTPFKLTVKALTDYVERNPGCTMDALLKGTQWHWKSLSTAKSCIYDYIRADIIKTLRIEDGKFYLKIPNTNEN